MIRPYKNKKELIDECVEVFLALSDSALAQSRGKVVGLDGLDDDKATQAARLAWSAIQRARLFCFDPSRWTALLSASSRYTSELAGLGPEARLDRPSVNEVDDVTRHLWGLSLEEAFDVGYWENGIEGGVRVGTLVITDDGWEAARVEARRKLKPAMYVGIDRMIEVAKEARKRGNKHVGTAALAQLVQAIREADEAPEDIEKLYSAFEDYGVHWPFPDRLPFDACFFCFGRRLDLVEMPAVLHARVRAAQLAELGVSSVYMLGYLVAWEGDTPFIFTALQFGEGDGMEGVGLLRTSAVGLIKTYEDGEWLQPASLDPWILTMLVKAINDHKQIVEGHPSTLTSKMARKVASKKSKHLLPLPAPFYSVDLKDELIAPPPKKMMKTASGRSIEWSHRWDVRGHECVRIERGPMPVLPKEAEKLQKRGYRIYEGTSLGAEDAARLLKRGIRAPGPAEWIAVLSYWRDSFVKGPEEKPYVPGARVEASSS